MDLENTFVVEAPIADVWDAFLEPDRVAPCFPGAKLTESDETSFTGTVKVKLGPIAMLYKGTGVYVDTDESARKAVIKANGKDSRGNGQANATVTMTLAETTPTSTTVVVATDLSITGKPAQLGRGIITEVAGKIIGQFADCLGQRLGAEADAIEAEDAADTPVEAVSAADSSVPDSAVPDSSAPESNGVVTGSAPQATEVPVAVTPKPSPSPTPRPRPKVDYPPTPDAIDLLESGAGTAVAKRVAPVAVGAVLGGLVVWLITRS
jgi:carbon monoxide dehydrogenase subunit G